MHTLHCSPPVCSFFSPPIRKKHLKNDTRQRSRHQGRGLTKLWSTPANVGEIPTSSCRSLAHSHSSPEPIHLHPLTLEVCDKIYFEVLHLMLFHSLPCYHRHRFKNRMFCALRNCIDPNFLIHWCCLKPTVTTRAINLFSLDYSPLVICVCTWLANYFYHQIFGWSLFKRQLCIPCEKI